MICIVKSAVDDINIRDNSFSGNKSSEIGLRINRSLHYYGVMEYVSIKSAFFKD